MTGIWVPREVVDALVEGTIGSSALAAWVALEQVSARERSRSFRTHHAEIAKLGGISRPTVQKALSELEAAGLLSMERHSRSVDIQLRVEYAATFTVQAWVPIEERAEKTAKARAV